MGVREMLVMCEGDDGCEGDVGDGCEGDVGDV